MATQEEIQKIEDATDIVKLVSNYVKLEKVGKNYKGLCPFHGEDTPSFVVSPEKNVAHCFGCGGGGSPIKFLEQIENIDFLTALEKLAKFNGIPFEAHSRPKANEQLTKYYKIMQIAVNFYKKNFDSTEEGQKAREYLKARGLDDQTIEDFKIGLSPKPGDTLYQVLKDSNVLELDMSDVGVVDKSNDRYYDLFSNRIMFPIYNEDGNPIGFSARIYNSKDKNNPKYINSRETILYKKANVIFNLQNAKGNIMRNKRIILHEGQMDVIASYRSGLKEAICTMGTALSLNQAKLLQKYANHAIICYDGDKAGINASLKAINVFKSLGFMIHLVLLPDGMDPDEYVLKYGEEKYKEYFLSNLLDENQYRLKVFTANKNFNDLNVLNQVKNDCFGMIAQMESKTEQEDYLKQLSKILDISYEALNADYSNFRGSIVLDSPIQANTNRSENYAELPFIEDNYTPKEIKKWYKMYEARLFGYARSSKSTALYIDGILSDRMEAMSFEGQSLWIRLINSFYSALDYFDEAAFLKMLSASEAEYYFNILEMLSKDKTPYTDEDLNDCLQKLKEDTYKVMNQALKNRILESNDSTKKSRLIDEMFRNKRNQAQLANIRRK